MGRPKALLEYQGETFVGRLVRVLSEVAEPTIVALGYHAGVIQDHIREHLESMPVTVAINLAPENGQLSSLQTALRKIPANADGFLFVPVDCPTVKTETVRRVSNAFAARSAETLLVVPSYGCSDDARHGHPVFASMKIAQELLALPLTASAREVIHAHRAETLYVDVDDSGILTDVDDPAAYHDLLEGTQTS